MAEQQLTAQQRFDSVYISSSEICVSLSISKSSITHARRRGILPDPVIVNGAQIYLWERSKVEPFLAAWKLMLNARRRIPLA